jgi:hypothetical protein
MISILKWLRVNKAINLMIGIIVYFSIVTFHDEITDLAIKLRNAVGRDNYNAYLAYFFIVILLVFVAYISFNIYKSKRITLNICLVAGISILMILAFRILMTYSIEAIHFVEYALLAIILFPLFRSYGETVFWVVILGMFDELFQYFFLVTNFDYFDFNDNVLNLLGTGAGAIIVFIFNEDIIPVKKIKWFRSPAILTGIGIMILFIALYLTGKMTFNPSGLADGASWFSLNRHVVNYVTWEEAYPGRFFHNLNPWEGLAVIYAGFAGFFGLDYFFSHRFSQI